MVDSETVDERVWQTAVKNAQRDLVAYGDAKNVGDDGSAREAELRVAESLKRIGDSHPDERVRKHWYQKSRNFLDAKDHEKRNMLADIGKGLGILVVAPVALVGFVLFGVGSVLKGLGTVFTGGYLRS
jgi:hypothetical protein